MPADQRYNSSVRSVSRPISVTLLALVVLSIATLNLVRCWQAFAQWSFLSGILPLSPLYLAISGAVWGLIGLPLFWSMWKGANWALLVTPYAAGAYSIYYWVDRLLVKTDVTKETIPFAIAANLAILGLIYWILVRKKAAAFFGVRYD